MRRQKSQLKQMINRVASEGQHGERAPHPAHQHVPGRHIQNRIDSLNQHNHSHYQTFENESGRFVYDGQSVYPEHQSPALSNDMSELGHIKQALGELSQRLAGMQQKPAVADYVPPQTNPVTAQEFDETLAEIHNSIASMIEQLPDRNQFEQLQASLASVAQAGPHSHAELTKVVEEGNRFVTKQMEEMRTSVTTSVAQAAGFTKTARDNAQEFRALAKQLKQSADVQQKNLQSQMTALQQQLAKNQESKIDGNFLQSSHMELMDQMKGIRKQLDENQANADDGKPNEALEAIELRLEDVNRAMVALSQSNNGSDQMDRLEARLVDLAKTMQEASNSTTSESLRPALDAVNAAVQGLTGKVNALAQQSGSDTSSASVQRLEALADRMDNLVVAGHAAGDSGTADPALLARLDAIVERVGTLNADQTTDALGQQVAEISSRFETAHAELLASGQNDRNVFFQHLEQIAETVKNMDGSQANTDQNAQLVILENNINHLAQQLSGISNAPVDLDPLAHKLDSIEEQVANSRDIAIELAAKAAEDAVQNAVQHLADRPVAGNGAESGLVGDLSKEIKALHKITTNSQQGNRAAFEEVTRSLKDMAMRLEEIEKGHSSGIPLEPDVANLPEAATASTETGSVEMAAKLSAIANQEAVEPSEQQPAIQSANPIGKALFDKAAKAEQARMLETDTSADSLDPYEKRELGAFNLGTGQPQPAEPAPLQTLDDEQTPVLDTSDILQEPERQAEVDAPLEPGTAGPDLAAMVRHANERRKSIEADGQDTSSTDFIAAARRAAQAAAEQASAAELEDEEYNKKPSGGLLSSIFSRRKKAIVLTIAAALLAAAIVPLAGRLMGEDGFGKVVGLDGLSGYVQSWTGSPELDQGTNEVAAASGNEPVAEGDVQAGTAEQEQSAIRQIETAPQSQEPAPSAEARPTVKPEASGNQVAEPKSPDIVAAPKFDGAKLATYAAEVPFSNQPLKTAVSQGDPAALFEVGRRYTDGVGVSKDLGQAAKWYQRAADMNHAPAQYLIGNFLEKGLGVEKDMQQAVGWYEKAANNGNIIAMHNLAVLYATPNAVAETPDNVMAFSWFKQAAEHGVRDSQVNLGIFYTKGVGTPVNLIEAYKWFDVAAKAGDKDAESKREIVSQALRPDQLDAAKNASSDWKAIEISSAANDSPRKREWMASTVSGQNAAISSPVARVQTMLSKLGYDVGTIDGIMGDKTRQAIARFQSQSDLPINGKISPDFLRKLEAKAI